MTKFLTALLLSTVCALAIFPFPTPGDPKPAPKLEVVAYGGTRGTLSVWDFHEPYGKFLVLNADFTNAGAATWKPNPGDLDIDIFGNDTVKDFYYLTLTDTNGYVLYEASHTLSAACTVLPAGHSIYTDPYFDLMLIPIGPDFLPKGRYNLQLIIDPFQRWKQFGIWDFTFDANLNDNWLVTTNLVR